MYITSDQHTKLAQGLFDKMIELKDAGNRNVKSYEVAYQDVIEDVFPDKCWYDVTSCDIFRHLMAYLNPEATILAILKGLKEDEAR